MLHPNLISVNVCEQPYLSQNKTYLPFISITHNNHASYTQYQSYHNTKYKVQVFRQKSIRDIKQKLFLNLTDLCSIKDFYQKLL